MLDNTLLVWTNELGKGNTHTLDNIPFVLVGGGAGFKMGRSLKFDKVPHNRLWLAVAHAMGHELDLRQSRALRGRRAGPVAASPAARIRATSRRHSSGVGSGETRGTALFFVLNDEINAARDVTKTNTYRVETFRSGELGFLGYVDHDQVAYYRAPEKRHTVNSEFDLSGIRELPKVEILYGYVEANTPVLIHALQQAGVRGIVFAASGAGMLSDGEKAAVKASPDTIFVRSSRVSNGRVITHKAHDDLGIVPADNLSPQKARILLMLALTRFADLSELRRVFSEY